MDVRGNLCVGWMGNQLVENGDKGSSKPLFLMPEAPKLIWAQRATGKTRPKAVDFLVSTKGGGQILLCGTPQIRNLFFGPKLGVF